MAAGSLDYGQEWPSYLSGELVGLLFRKFRYRMKGKEKGESFKVLAFKM